MLRFTIVITETQEVDKKIGHVWEKIAAKQEGGEDGYGYTPLIDSIAIEKVEVLRQLVSDLDLVAVIKAINGIS